MQTKQSQSSSQFFLQWVLATFLGVIVGFIVGVILEFTILFSLPLPESFFTIFLLVMMGASMGWFQSLVLRSKITPYRQWVLITSIGMLVGTTISTLIFDLTENTSLIFFFSTIGVTLGIAQWFVLRPHASQSSLWIIANVLGMLAGATWNLSVKAYDATDEFQAFIFFLFVILRVWIVYSITTGIVLTWLLRKNPEREYQQVE